MIATALPSTEGDTMTRNRKPTPPPHDPPGPADADALDVVALELIRAAIRRHEEATAALAAVNRRKDAAGELSLAADSAWERVIGLALSAQGDAADWLAGAVLVLTGRAPYHRAARELGHDWAPAALDYMGSLYVAYPDDDTGEPQLAVVERGERVEAAAGGWSYPPPGLDG